MMPRVFEMVVKNWCRLLLCCTFAAVAPLLAQPNLAAARAQTHSLTLARSFTGAEQMTMTHFLQNYRQALGFSQNDALQAREVFTDALGYTHHRLQQYYRGVAIADRTLLVHEREGKIYFMHGDAITGLDLEVAPRLSETEALRLVLAHLGAQQYMWEDPNNEAFLQREQDNAAATFFPKGMLCLSAGHAARAASDFHLVYRFDVYAAKPLGRYAVDVDAQTGAIVKVTSRLYESDVAGQGLSVYNGRVMITVDQRSALSYRLREVGRGKGIETYDMKHTTSFGSAVDFSNNDTSFVATNAQAGVSVHWAAENTYDYYRTHHNRRSYDNSDGKIQSYAHFDNSWFNAQWDGSRMRFGDGNNNASPLVALDIVAHEFTHGVTQYSADLVYASESGALNESFSDIFGNAVEFAVLDTSGSWDVGQGAVRIRSMANPRIFGDPKTYLGSGWAPTANPNAGNDNGGVHTNSGVQNYWFYLLVEGGSGVNDNGEAYNVAGLGLQQAEKIAYRNLTVYMTQNSGYFDARMATLQSASDLYGKGSPQFAAALAAWEAVGVYYPKLAPTIVASTDTVSFLAEAAVARDTSQVTITNLGMENLTLSNFKVSGAGFQFLNAPNTAITLSYGNSLTLRVLFTPTTASVVHGTLSLSSNDPQQAAYALPLRGKGFAIRPAAQNVVYANAGRVSKGVLFTISPATGAGTAVGGSTFDELSGIALRASNNLIYGTVATSAGTTITRVDALTGEAYALLTVPVSNMRAIAFDSNDIIYGAQFTTGKIYRFSLASGDTAAVGNTKLTLLSGLAISPVDGSLWATRATGQTLYRIDKATAAVTAVGSMGITPIADIEFDGAGKLFGLAGFGANVVSDYVQINLTTAKATKIGSTAFKSAYGLAMRGTITSAVAAPAVAAAPQDFALAQNHPNPFNPSTTITFHLPRAGFATLRVYDLSGREVATLWHDKLAAGEHRVRFNASTLAAGVYVYRLEAEGQVATRKLLLVK